MIYRAIGLMSGSSLDGLDIAMVEFEEVRGQWNYNVEAADTIAYSDEWKNKLQSATQMNARDYLHLHSEYGLYLGKLTQEFIENNHLEHRVQMIASHGHTTFHEPQNQFTAQLGDGAAIAAETNINVVSDLRALDVALGGQGAPIVPMGEKFLFPDYGYYLNIGGITNISIQSEDKIIAFDVAPANRILNLLAAKKGQEFDGDGNIAAAGKVDTALLTKLNSLDYYKNSGAKSLANDFGTDTIFPIIENAQLSTEDAMATYIEHIAMQIGYAVSANPRPKNSNKMLITGGGAFNAFLIKRISYFMKQYGIEVVIPEKDTVAFKEAIIMAFLGLLRWREENTTLATVTGASRNSIGGAIWMGQEY
ncbi:anhydro-N-acetylmuramic acid kinase [Rhizosphaericola mali]|uniref:Anhydro-N-acetylmuramic acid kinase n=1 Tax=Rhizosphaericola mali TaxID=2545455 RepID=A0A5P2G6T1_9BACT|nr:anhydro-N-acetylmuramic acid kinase [Rhizosphaericola mali]QES89490.1 anhydro-N-acetylmuramic acid kinase [Rhizosphaericola mali]